MRNIEFVPKAFNEYKKWIETDRRTALRISDLKVLANQKH